MRPLTLPYMYTLSKNISFAFVRLQASIALYMMRGHRSRQTLMSYFRPTSKNTTVEPATARMV